METLLFGRKQHLKRILQKHLTKEEDFTVSRAVCPPWSGVTSEELQSGQVEINRAHTAIEMAHKYAEENKREEVKLPEQFKNHAALFSDEEANKLPPVREWDHKGGSLDRDHHQAHFSHG